MKYVYSNGLITNDVWGSSKLTVLQFSIWNKWRTSVGFKKSDRWVFVFINVGSLFCNVALAAAIFQGNRFRWKTTSVNTATSSVQNNFSCETNYLTNGVWRQTSYLVCEKNGNRSTVSSTFLAINDQQVPQRLVWVYRFRLLSRIGLNRNKRGLQFDKNSGKNDFL